MATASGCVPTRRRWIGRPSALLSGRLDVEALSLGGVVSGAAAGGFRWLEETGDSFTMPLSLRIARFEVSDLLLAEPVLGAAARLSIDGSAALADPS